MSEGIKRMLAERAKIEADAEAARKAAAKLDAKWDKIVRETFALIDKAAPFMDEGSDPTKWPPSALLKISYCVSASSPHEGSEKRAIQFILTMLDKARERWVAGFHADPWTENPARRYPE